MTHFRTRSLALLLAALVVALPATVRSQDAAPPKRLSRSAMPAPGEKKLPWLAFDAAAERAMKEGKHVIVDIYTTWCGWCKVMERETYGNPEVADYLLSNFVLAKVNGESSSKVHWKGREITEREFTRSVGVTGFPTTYFLKPNLEVLGGRPGYIRPSEFLIISRFVNTKWYEKGTLQDYLKEMQAGGTGPAGGAGTSAPGPSSPVTPPKTQ
jgi:thioredoxin-related protein